MYFGDLRQRVVGLEDRQRFAEKLESVILDQRAANTKFTISRVSIVSSTAAFPLGDLFAINLQRVRRAVHVLFHWIPRDVAFVQVAADIVYRDVSFPLFAAVWNSNVRKSRVVNVVGGRFRISRVSRVRT